MSAHDHLNYQYKISQIVGKKPKGDDINFLCLARCLLAQKQYRKLEYLIVTRETV